MKTQNLIEQVQKLPIKNTALITAIIKKITRQADYIKTLEAKGKDEYVKTIEGEFHFEKKQSDYLYSVLTEIENLPKDNIAKAIAKNAKERFMLNKCVHAEELFS